MADAESIADWPTPELTPSDTSQFCIDVPRLLQRCESLGDGCDLGMAQRAVGIEPFGLFRFAGLKSLAVIRLLRTNLQDIGDPEDLWLQEVPPKREYRVKSRQYPSYTSHSGRFGGIDDPEVVRLAQIEMTRFLKAKLLRDLALGGRLFVHRGPADLKLMARIANELRGYGDNGLLWVKLANDKNPPGTLRVREGLVEGFISRFGVYEANRTPRLPVEEWIEICAKAYRLWRKTDPPMTALENLISAEMEPESPRAPGSFLTATRVLNEEAPSGGSVMEHRLGKSELSTIARLSVPVTAGGPISFSAWVRLPKDFHGGRIIPAVPRCTRLTSWNADTKSVGGWQRIWATAKAPAEADRISCELLAEGEIGDIFQSASWCLERRDLPSGFGFRL
jgi:hypothetical protein